MKTKSLIVIVLLALAVGGTCPSDVNNDGSVGIQDFLQLLGDWGPCPNPRVISMNVLESASDGLAVRLWSDNTLQIGAHVGTSDLQWTCPESFPSLGQWSSIEAPPTIAEPVAVSGANLASDPRTIWVTYADGSVYTRKFDIHSVPGCSPPGVDTSHNIFKWNGDWTPFEGGGLR